MTLKNFEKVGPMRLPVLLSDGRVFDFQLFTYKFNNSDIYYVVEKGNVKSEKYPLVRVHSACSFAHVFNSQRCDDRFQLDEALLKIANCDAGLVIYAWPHEGRGVGMFDHTRVYVEQDKGRDTVSAYEVLGLPVDSRNYGDVINILQDYKIKNMALLTNNPRKIEAFEKAGIKTIRVPLIARLSEYNESQLHVKVEKLGHYYDLQKAKDKSQTLFYEGIEGLKFVLDNMLDDLTPGKEYCVFASGKMATTLGSYYYVFQKEKSKRKIHSFILYSDYMKNRNNILNQTIGEKKFYPLAPFSSDTFIYDNKILMISWLSTPPFAVLVVDNEATKSFKEIFSGLWNIHIRHI